jgi:hypothetical protein
MGRKFGFGRFCAANVAVPPSKARLLIMNPLLAGIRYAKARGTASFPRP